MGVKWTCTLLFLSGIVYLAVEATSVPHAEAETSFQQAIADEARSFGENSPMDRKKRETIHTVKDDGKGNRQESTSHTDKNGGFASSSSSSSSNNGGGGNAHSSSFGFGSANVGSRSSFSESGSSKSQKSGQNPPQGGSKGQNPSQGGSKGQNPSQGSSKGNNSPPGGSQGPDWSRGNFPGQEWAQGNQWPNFGGPNFGAPGNRQFGPNVGSFPNNYPYQNPTSNNAPGFNVEDPIEQFFRNIEEQQRLLYARLRGPYQSGSNSWAHAAAFVTSPNGGVQPDTRSYSNSWSSTPVRYTGGASRGAGHTMRQHNQAVKRQQRFYDMNNAIEYGSPLNNYYPNPGSFGSRGAFGADFGNFDSFNQGFPNSAGGGFPNFFSNPQGGNGAFASASFGPNGGFRQAEVRPGSPGVESRFAEEAPRPSGQSFGVFTSSHSSSETDANGRQIQRNRAVTGINDNGKISVHTVGDR